MHLNPFLQDLEEDTLYSSIDEWMYLMISYSVTPTMISFVCNFQLSLWCSSGTALFVIVVFDSYEKKLC